MSKYDLEHIRKQLTDGDYSCLQSIFNEESDFCIKNLVRRTGCRTEDAQDIFVESMLNFREKVLSNKLETLTNVRNYLFTTCRNMWALKLRKEASNQRKITQMSLSFYNEYENDKFTDLKELEEEKNLLMITNDSFQQLSEQCKDILYHFYVYELSMNEIVEVLNISNVNVARVLKHRCFTKLKSIASSLLK